tara:strand:+ start:5754 stop:6335 length:582 start_codon:yes stop_codon:yes gene_type:complete
MSDIPNQPISDVKWVSVDDVEPNDYNPNSVAGQEMKLLHTSIKHDGYTQPIVTIYDEEKKKYVIVDGFHRYFTCKNNKDIFDTTQGRVPIVVIKKDINERMAATVRHNRARGQHSVSGMSNMVFSMLDNGWKDEEICNHLGMEPDELLRLKHITGFSKLFADTDYNKAWVTKHQIRIKKEFKDSEKDRQTNNG